MLTLKSRFERKVNTNGPIPAAYTGLTTRCHVWTGALNDDGYGVCRFEGKTKGAHIVSFVLTNGSVNECVLHRCDNRACVNPLHLFEGTRMDNYLDARSKGRGPLPPSQLERRNVGYKLSEEKVQEIRATYSQGNKSQREIARSLGVSQRLIGMIVRGEAWKYTSPICS
jgi:hypothetical protein